jgi:Ribosomal protein L32
VRIGYGSDKRTKYIRPNGFKTFLVHNVKELEVLLMANRVYITHHAHLFHLIPTILVTIHSNTQEHLRNNRIAARNATHPPFSAPIQKHSSPHLFLHQFKNTRFIHAIHDLMPTQLRCRDRPRGQPKVEEGAYRACSPIGHQGDKRIRQTQERRKRVNLVHVPKKRKKKNQNWFHPFRQLFIT